MRKFKVSCLPIRLAYAQRNGREIHVPLQDWTQEEIDDYLRRHESAFRRRCKVQKQR